MKLNYLYEFLALARYKNYHVAAKTLQISQSTLTNHIKALEAEFNVTLFNRNTRNVELSEYGKIFYPYAESFIKLCDNCAQALNKKRHIDKIILRIALEPHYLIGELLSIFNNFKKAYENVVIEFVNAPIDASRRMLRTGRCDVAIAPQEDSFDTEFKTINIRAEHAVLVVGQEHPFAQRQGVNLKDLEEERLFLPPDRLVLHKMLIEACHSVGFVPNVMGSGISEVMGKTFATKGLGISVQSNYFANRLVDNSIRIVDINPKLKWYVNLLYSDVHTTDLAQAFLKFVLAALSGKAERPFGDQESEDWEMWTD